jgi:hypothetical protein
MVVHAEDLLDQDDAALRLAAGGRRICVQREAVARLELDFLAHLKSSLLV